MNRAGLRLTSVSMLKTPRGLKIELERLGFEPVSVATTVSDGKFWSRRIYRRGAESVSVSTEAGEVLYLRDPVITILAGDNTMKRLDKVLKQPG